MGSGRGSGFDQTTVKGEKGINPLALELDIDNLAHHLCKL